MDIELFIAKRLYHARRGGRKISRPATTIAQWGVSVGIIVMMLSLAIVIGFKKEVREKIIGFGGHIQVNNYETNDNEPPYVIVTAADIENIRACEGVTNAVTNIQKPGLLAVGEEFEGVMFKGMKRECTTLRSLRHICSKAPYRHHPTL